MCEIYKSRVVWIRVFGVPLHAWDADFFVALVKVFGTFVCIDENTSNRESLDIARIMLKN